METFRWLEAVRHRREYIEHRIGDFPPVFAASRPQGILLLGVGSGQSSVFEIFDQHGMAALGNPVDVEKLRHVAIEAAHTEAFNRSSEDVTLRRLINFALSAALKNSFEEIYAPPIMAESVFAELGKTPADDTLCQLSFDGDYEFISDGLAIVCPNKQAAFQARSWIQERIDKKSSLKQVALVLMSAWTAIKNTRRFEDTLPVIEKFDELELDGHQLEVALLDRKSEGRVRFTALDSATLKK